MICEFFLGFIKIHILHHASCEPVYGLWLMEELKRHGYSISPGTLYPVLHSLKKEELLEAENRVVEGKIRKYYRITPEGKNSLGK